MKHKRILITGGAGFVGSVLAIKLKKEYPDTHVISLDNLKRRGSELNIRRLIENGIEFSHGDIRNKEDLEFSEKIDLVLECSAEPSVLAGVSESPEYLINTNLTGTINCLEVARKHKADFMFLSTSRVYPISEIENLDFVESEKRFDLSDDQKIVGVSKKGIAENFPLGKYRSLYGATKLCSEMIFQEYRESYGIKGVVNRCGVITGPWQMGKVDQGVIVLWLARHIWPEKPLSYIGYGGEGKQVRDFMHIDDLFEAIKIQIENIDKYDGEIYNIGGGLKNSLSLSEMTDLCREVTGNEIEISQILENRPNDIRLYVSDCSRFADASGWECKKDARATFQDIYEWIKENEKDLKRILG
jgi:CDP-paratose 2-epimerase